VEEERKGRTIELSSKECGNKSHLREKMGDRISLRITSKGRVVKKVHSGILSAGGDTASVFTGERKEIASN